jgi:predicted TIM-barrel fold metal-dependent hydrolase
MPFETSRAAANLIYQGVLQRYPNITWQLSHLGGTLLHVLYRLGMLQVAPYAGLANDAAPDGPFAAARRFYYDTAIGGSEEQLLSARKLTGAERLVFGTDYPYVNLLFEHDARQNWPWFGDMLPAAGDPEPVLSRLFDPAERLLIDRDNALALYPSLATPDR